MKKLKLDLRNIEGVELLTREQLKKIVGGGTCQCENPGSYENPITGLSKNEAEGCSEGGGHWCCDSCCDATWADHTDC